MHALSGRRHSWIGSGQTRLTDKSSTSLSTGPGIVLWFGKVHLFLVYAILIISCITFSVTATGIRLDPKNGILDVPWCFVVSQAIVCVSVMYEE